MSDETYKYAAVVYLENGMSICVPSEITVIEDDKDPGLYGYLSEIWNGKMRRERFLKKELLSMIGDIVEGRYHVKIYSEGTQVFIREMYTESDRKD